MKHFTVCFILFYIAINAFGQNGYKIEIVIPTNANKDLILGHHWSKSIIPDDTITLDKKGKGAFEGDIPLPQGLYILFFPEKKMYFDILVGENQHFTLYNDTTNFMENYAANNDYNNEMFAKYQLFLKKQREKATNINKQLKNAKDEKEKAKLREELREIQELVTKTQKENIADDPESFFSAFVKATIEIEVPDPPKDENSRVIDSMWQYHYYKNHYFDNFDISDTRLLRTPFYNNKVIRYVDKVVPQVPDSIIPEVDMLIERSKQLDEMFRNMLVNLFNHYAKSNIMGMDAVFFHLAEKYYLPEASWSDSTFKAKLRKELKEKGHLLIGNIAPDFQFVQIETEHFIESEGDTAMMRDPYVGHFVNLHEVNADFIILAFWEVDCGHCKKQIPKLYELYQNLKHKNLEVISLHMIGSKEGKEKWIKFINSRKLYDWMNVWSPYSYEYKKQYAIKSTPVIMVLDKDKKIVAKRIGTEQAEEIINHLIEKNKTKE